MQTWLLGAAPGTQYELLDWRAFVVSGAKMAPELLEQAVDAAVAFVRHLPAGWATAAMWAAPPAGGQGEPAATGLVDAPASLSTPADDPGAWLSASANTVDGV